MTNTPFGAPITSYTQPEANRATRLFLEQQQAYALAKIGVRTGFPSVDAAVPAFLPADLCVFHGMTGECKTTVVQKVINNIADGMQARAPRKDGKRPVIAYFHSEELTEIINVRLWGDRLITPKSVIEGKAKVADVERRSLATSGRPIVFIGGAEMQEKIHPDKLEDFGAMTVDGIAAACHEMITNDNLAPEVVVIDHMHDLSLKGGGSLDEQNRIAAVFQRIAWFKTYMKTTVILVCQDNDRTIMQRSPEDRQPRKTDISYSQGVLRTAAAIFSVWKPSQHLDLGPSDVGSIERLTVHGRQVLNLTRDSIVLHADKLRYSDAAGTTFLLSGRGSTGTWGDVQEVDTSKWPVSGKTKLGHTPEPSQSGGSADHVPLGFNPPTVDAKGRKTYKPKLDPIDTFDGMKEPPFKEEIVLDREEWHTS